MESDDVYDTLNYASVYQVIKKEAARPVKLLEKLAGNISTRLLTAFPAITAIDMRITKLNPPIDANSEGNCGIEIHLINPKTEC